MNFIPQNQTYYLFVFVFALCSVFVDVAFQRVDHLHSLFNGIDLPVAKSLKLD